MADSALMDGDWTLVAYCENCREQTRVRIEASTENLELHGITYSYPVRYGYCCACGEKATPQNILDDNQRSFSQAVRTANNIVSQETVEEMVTRYNIKPRPLSSLLGWGEHTYSRFIEGDIPSKSFSDRISALLSCPLSYLLLLLNNGDSISGVAHRKSWTAAQDSLVVLGPKADRVAAYLLGKTESNSSLALQKELYYAQGLMMTFYGKPLIPERCEAWVMGPVFPDVWNRIKTREVAEERLAGSGLDDCVRDTFTDEELSVLDAVVTYVARYSPYVLRDITHEERPWLNARESLPKDTPSDALISVDDIKSYFDDIRQKYHMSRPADVSTYMEEMLHK